MNNGKICVSVCAKTADELIQQIKRAEELADVIEIRFDCLEVQELEKVLQNFPLINSTLLATLRTKDQGGKRDISGEEQLYFWKSFNEKNVNSGYYEDIELTRTFLANLSHSKTILSLHFFTNVPDNLSVVYESMFKFAPWSIAKLAIKTDDITNSIPIWQLLERAKSENKRFIQIAMGESGKWTRILGMAHGAFMTYASLDSGSETAPGQVSAKDLIEVYRAKELDEKTDVYGILGSNTSVSMSPYIHNPVFKFHKLNAVFVPLQVQNLDEFIRRMVKPETREVELNFKGFSVTILHKETIIKHLDYVDETARKIGAVNTVKIIDGKLYGYNTDAKGFIEPLKNVYGDLKDAKVAVIGAGGAARACVYALKKEGADVTIFARNIEKAKDLAASFDANFGELRITNYELRDFEIVVNSTPLGMKGKAEGETPLKAEQIKGVKLVYDLVYIPQETELIKQAKSLNIPTINGVEMLLAQAIEQQKIWTGLDAPMKVMSQELLKRLA